MSCTHCRGKTPTGIYLCHQHTIDLKDLLDRIPDVLADAEDTIAKLDVLGNGSGGGSDPAAGSAAPLNLEASERKRELQEAIQQWARVVLADDTTPGLQGIEPLTYLRMSVDPPSSSEKNPGLRIVQRTDSGEMLAKLSEGARYLLVAIDLPPNLILLGRCATVIEGEQCPGRITARDGDHEARCQTCGATYGVAEVQAAHISEAWHHFAPLPVVVRSLRQAGFKVTERSAQRWVKNGELVASKHRDDGIPIYTLAEMRDCAKRMRERHGGRRLNEKRQVAYSSP